MITFQFLAAIILWGILKAYITAAYKKSNFGKESLGTYFGRALKQYFILSK